MRHECFYLVIHLIVKWYIFSWKKIFLQIIQWKQSSRSKFCNQLCIKTNDWFLNVLSFLRIQMVIQNIFFRKAIYIYRGREIVRRCMWVIIRHVIRICNSRSELGDPFCRCMVVIFVCFVLLFWSLLAHYFFLLFAFYLRSSFLIFSVFLFFLFVISFLWSYLLKFFWESKINK